MTTEIVASPKQQVIYDTWQNEDSNIVINAVAGSGKTTVLLQILEFCEKKTLFLAFNKSIQEEIQNKIEKRRLGFGKAMTLHSLGLSAVRTAYKSLTVNNSKNFDLIKSFQKLHPKYFRGLKWSDKLGLSYSITDLGDTSRLFMTEDFDEIIETMATLDSIPSRLPLLKELWPDFLLLRNTSYLDSRKIVVDFIDMIYVPVRYNIKLPFTPAYLLVDEAQDLNMCQHMLIDNLIAQGVEKWIAVGDRNQSIYLFSGSHSTSFDLFAQKENVVELPLDICYRCGSNIVSKANEVYDVMESYEGAGTGLVNTITNPLLIKADSMVVCRNTQPLIDLYFELSFSDKSCYLKGDDILKPILRFLNPYKGEKIGQAIISMDEKLADLKAKGVRNQDKLKDFFIYRERYIMFRNIFTYLSGKFNITSSDLIIDVIRYVKEFFIVKDEAITLCTIHKAKGLENDVVYILDEWMIPSKYATTPAQLTQEQNLKYVARTRALKELYFLNLNKKPDSNG